MPSGKNGSATYELRSRSDQIRKHRKTPRDFEELVSEYLESTGRGDLVPNPYQPDTWSQGAIELELFEELAEGDEKSRDGLRKCLALNYLKPSFPVNTRRLQVPLYLEDLRSISIRKMVSAEKEQSAYRTAGDDTADGLDSGIRHWKNISNYFGKLIAKQPSELDEQDLKFLEQEYARLQIDNPFGSHNAEPQALNDLKKTIYAAYIKKYFPKIYLRRSPPEPTAIGRK